MTPLLLPGSIFFPLPMTPPWGGLIEIGMPRKPYVPITFSLFFRNTPIIFQFSLPKKDAFYIGMPGASRQGGPRGGMWGKDHGHLVKLKSGKPMETIYKFGYTGDVMRIFMGYERNNYMLTVPHGNLSYCLRALFLRYK